MGVDKYPITTTAANDVLLHYKKPPPERQVRAPPAEFTLFQCGDTYNNKILPGENGIPFLVITCYRCQETVNYAGI